MAFPIETFESAPFEIIDGDRGKAYPKQHEFRPSGHCLFLSAANVTKTGFDLASGQFVDEQKDAQLRKGKLRRHDVVLTTRGTLGNSAFYDDEVPYNHVRINSGMVILRCDPSKIQPRYLYAFLRSAIFHGQVERMRSGAAQPQLPIRDMKRIELPLPSPTQQERLVEVVSAYDDLIETNRRRIALLEEAARLLHREWFVHFRFPGHEHVPLTDGLPEGWERRTLLDLAEVVMGQSPKSQFYNDAGNGLPFHQGVTDYGFRFVSHRTYSTMVTKIAEAGDILVSVRAPVGRINITRDKIVLGRGLSAIRSRTGHQSFLFYALKNHFYAEDIIGSGAIYAATNKKELEGQELVVPSSMLLTEFEAQAATFDRQIANLTSQNEKLAQARDLLLPRLMNGEIAV